MNDRQGFDITSATFKNLYSDALHWKPRIWAPYGDVQDFTIDVTPLPFDPLKFKIYVDKNSYFLPNFDALDTTWANGTNTADIRKAKVDKK